jgi:plastocyanin
MRKLLALLALCALAATAALGVSVASSSGRPAADTATHTVRVGDNFFSPTLKRRARGRIVTFVWVGDNRHNVRGYRWQRFNSGGKRSGTYSIRLRARRGTLIRYVCDFHPGSMRGAIRVL